MTNWRSGLTNNGEKVHPDTEDPMALAKPKEAEEKTDEKPVDQSRVPSSEIAKSMAGWNPNAITNSVVDALESAGDTDELADEEEPSWVGKPRAEWTPAELADAEARRDAIAARAQVAHAQRTLEQTTAEARSNAEDEWADAMEEEEDDQLTQAGAKLLTLAGPEAFSRAMEELTNNRIAEVLEWADDDELADAQQEVLDDVNEIRRGASRLASQAQSQVSAAQASEGRSEVFEKHFGTGPQAVDGFKSVTMLQAVLANDESRIAMIGDSDRANQLAEIASADLSTLSPRDLEMTLRTLAAVEAELQVSIGQQRHGDAISRAQESILEAPSRSVADGLETAATRQARAIEEQNRLLADDTPAPLSVEKIFARMAGRDPDARTPRPDEQSADEVRKSVTADDTKNWRDGLTHKGRPADLGDTLARSAGFKSAKAQREHENSEASARSRGLRR